MWLSREKSYWSCPFLHYTTYCWKW